MNPWIILAAVLALGAGLTGAYIKGGHDKENSILAEQKRQDELVQKVQTSIATSVAAIEVKNVTIKQRMEREIVEKTVFRDCKSGPDLVRQYNAIATGSSEPAGDSELPAASPAG